MIPKFFHFIWLNRGKSMGFMEYLSIRSKIHLYKSEYKYILWTDDLNLSIPHKDWLLSNGLQIKYIFDEVNMLSPNSDLWNYWDAESGIAFECDYYKLNLLNKFGGIYSDLDSISIKKINEGLLNWNWVSDVEYFNGNPYGSFVGFFLCNKNNEYFYRFHYLREHILPKYSPTIQLGLLCGNCENTLFTDGLFSPFPWTDLGKFLNSNLELIDFNSYEVHLYNDALSRFNEGNELMNTKLKAFEAYLDNKYNKIN